MNVTSLLVQQVYIPFSVAPYTFLQHYNKGLTENRLTDRGMGDGGGETKKEREREIPVYAKKRNKKKPKKTWMRTANCWASLPKLSAH